MLGNSYTPIFYFFLPLSKNKMSAWDTDGSFREDFLDDTKGKTIKTDRLFFNLYDY